ncbi:Glutaredoxin [Roseateles sp. YR242]|uniref:glutaredoxin family protein n=1 Tax=Roseateles sp. YR242 TaxID=1855305 RepID=UPI0008D82E9A|nr:glutaredoxin family protein [Roseateles sp. YR242]SEL43469.1 Glutaredoxin [Roseateles sp. YR242]
MKQRCPRCLHVRQPDANVPDWQCPACGIAYAKAYGEAPVAGQPQARVRPSRVSQDGGGLLGSWVFKALIAIAVVLAVGTSQRWFSPAHRAPAGPASPVDIAIYTTSTCVYCHQAMAYMDQRHVAYTEYNIERDPARFREFRRLGGQGTPLIVVGDEVLHGFEAGMLQDAIDRGEGR